MSLETWKTYFYPMPAKDVLEEDALKHSLIKWRGLRQHNLKAHGLIVNKNDNIMDKSGKILSICSQTCSLCQAFKIDCHMLAHDEDPCEYCPLFRYGENCMFEYRIWEDCHDPEPMIKRLQEAYYE